MRALAAACEAGGQQDLKLVLREREEGHVPSQFLAVAGGAVVGYAGADQGQDVEICGMVHPAHRRRGIGGSLLEATLGAAAQMGRETALVICEEAGPVALEWMRRRGGELDSSELRMVLRLGNRADDRRDGQALPGVELRRSTAADRRVLRHLLEEGFPGTDDATLDMMLSRHDEVQEQSLMAWDGDLAVGTMRVVDFPGRSMVYGLVIDSAVRGRGFGSAAMRAALDQMRQRGVPEVSLEVLPDNTPAVRLYTALGFRTVTTYRYMRVGTDRVSAD